MHVSCPPHLGEDLERGEEFQLSAHRSSAGASLQLSNRSIDGPGCVSRDMEEEHRSIQA